MERLGPLQESKLEFLDQLDCTLNILLLPFYYAASLLYCNPSCCPSTLIATLGYYKELANSEHRILF
jgi:hypothetical protein